MEHFIISCGCTYSKRACRLLSRRTRVSPFSQKLFISLGENRTFFGIYGFAITYSHLNVNTGNPSVLRQRCEIRREDFQGLTRRGNVSRKTFFPQELGAFYTKENIWRHQYLTNRECSDLTFIDLFVFQIALIFAKKTKFSHERRRAQHDDRPPPAPLSFHFFPLFLFFWGEM